ncbi:Sporulation-specific wall maturation protein [Nakaseomyces bracarensis]|uniref:Sporulation-specific wall maturation protein n=1 Tax=Nakaseomyces bracarensis TaxID=273131 RepID=A0ABR4NUN4_9SACH
MKFQTALTAMLAASAIASPIDGLFNDKKKKTTSTSTHGKQLPTALAALLGGNSNTTSTNSTVSNTTNSSMTNSTMSNMTNMTNSTTAEIPQLQVIYTGGRVPIMSNMSNATFHTNSTKLFNATNALNITELYSVAANINETLANNNTMGAVVVSNAKSLESLGFFSSIVLDSEKPIVISEVEELALCVANDTGAMGRGALVVTKNGIIYSGVFTPSSATSIGGIPVGVVDDAKKVNWYLAPSVPALVHNNGTIRTNYTNFTSTDVFNVPLVPIVYDGGYSSSLISSLASSVNGLVVVSSGSSNSTTSTIESAEIPIVYADESALFSPVSTKDVPENSISGGYLSPIKAQILLSIAAANGVTTDESLSAIFP